MIFDANRPLWGKALLHAHWWMQKYGVRPTRERIRCFIQRGKRGWSYRDVWSLDSYLNDVLIGSLTELKKQGHGYPAGTGAVQTAEDWERILDEMIAGFVAANRITDVLDPVYEGPDDKALADLHAAHALAMDHLKTYWFNLWD